MLKERVDIASTTEEYVEEQHHCGQAIFELYLQRLLDKAANPRILDAGCGVGKSVMALVNAGFDAYGIDLPNLAPFWAAAHNDRDRFVEASATQLPFADATFDFVYSFGVIEHIGTVNGHCTLASDYRRQREQYAQEILRVTRPGGRILIACPNKTFPIDIQHGPGDQIRQAGRLRSYIFDKTGMNLHKTWGRYHLLSYPEVKSLFAGENGRRQFTALPLNNYFQFGRFKSGFLKPFTALAHFWVDNMPESARRTFLNPYVMAEIRK
jgi:SAM-dependent methyltransferase